VNIVKLFFRKKYNFFMTPIGIRNLFSNQRVFR